MNSTKKARSVDVRTRMRFYENIDTGLYRLLMQQPEHSRGEYLRALLSRAAVLMGLESGLPMSPVDQHLVRPTGQPSLPSARTTFSEGDAKAPPDPKPTKEGPQALLNASTSEVMKVSTEESVTSAGARGMAALGFDTWAEVSDAFDYSSPSAHQDAGT